MQKRFLLFGTFSGAIAVDLGAMGAHFLKTKLELGLLTLTNLQAFETAVRYQIYHSILLIIFALLFDKVNNKLLLRAGQCIITGIVLFSGSIYLLSTSELLGLSVRFLGPITPIGGLFLILGWLLLGISGISKKTNSF